MRLLPRRQPDEAAPPAPEQERPGGKGRPTPKRSTARAERAKAATSRPNSRGGRREERRQRATEYREAMRSTDPKKLPERERVPERVIARDVVDSRPSSGVAALAVIVADLLFSFLRSTTLERALTLAFYAILIVYLIDWTIYCQQARRAIRAQVETPTVRVNFYIFMRALMPKRWRRPPARV